MQGGWFQEIAGTQLFKQHLAQVHVRRNDFWHVQPAKM
ncbi:MAG: hypothetical protein ACJA1E_000169 [Paracoccaceae bacterium]|jgi:hypothetical protein